MGPNSQRRFRKLLIGLLIVVMFCSLYYRWSYLGARQKQVILQLEEKGCLVTYADIAWWNLYRRLSVAILGNEGGNLAKELRLSTVPFVSKDDDVALFRLIETLPTLQRLSIECRSKVIFPNQMRLPNLREISLRAAYPDLSLTDNGGLDFPQVEDIFLVNTRCSDEVLSKFSNLTNLKGLALVGRNYLGSFLKDAEFKESLKCLVIEDCEMSDQFIEDLRDYRNLTRLSLRGTSVSNKVIPIIGNFRELESLDLADTKVSLSGISKLDHLGKLEHLCIGTIFEDFEGSSGSYATFPKFPSLKVLFISIWTLDVRLMRNLSQFDELDRLSISFDKIEPDVQSTLKLFYNDTSNQPENRLISLSGTIDINNLLLRFKKEP